MLKHPERGHKQSAIAGCSVFYITRELRDCGGTFIQDVSLFYSFFYFLEEIRLLDHNDPLDLYVLHYAMVYTDWTRPVPIDKNSDIVRVEELSDVLSASKKATLRQQITDQDLLYNCLKSGWSSFTIANVFVHAAAT